MKIAPSFISREKLIKKAAKRASERIAEHTTVSSAFQDKEADFIKSNLDSAARYASRHHVNLEFMPNLNNYRKDGTKVNVYRRVIRQTQTFDGSDPIIYGDQEFRGSAIIGQEINTKKDFMKNLREQVKQILTK